MIIIPAGVDCLSRLLIVSNRLPVSTIKKRGEIHILPSAGGLATGLSSFYRSYNGLWMGWPGIALEKIKGSEEKVREAMRGLQVLIGATSQKERRESKGSTEI